MNPPGRPASGAAPAPLAAGDTVGRYVVEGPIGAGAMGQVFAAIDPELDRSIAIKLVHHTANPEEERLLLEEARVLARLTHPNVVRIYDAGVSQTRAGRKAFLAMERASGRTLWDWLRAGPHPWRDVVKRMADAARGLGAAHDAGLVHGDFKPSNVLISIDDRPLVADFGLARPHGEGMKGELTGDGTPAFAAPELRRGARPSPFSDQFSFGVSLYESLYGVLPFPGDDLRRIAKMAASGPPRAPDGARRLPRRVRAVYTRCLDPDPTRRFRSLTEVADALDRAGSPVRRSVLVAAVASAALGVVVFWPSAPPAMPRGCAELQTRARQTFSPAERGRGRAAFDATKLIYAGTAWTTVERILDTHVRETARRGEALCHEAGAGGETEALIERRVECLDHVLSQVDDLAEGLARATPRMVESAVGAAFAMPRPASCDQPGPPPSDAIVRRFETRLLVDEVSRLRAWTRLGLTPDAKPELEALLKQARRIEAPALAAEALINLSNLSLQAREVKPAIVYAEEALVAAEVGADDRMAAYVAITLADALSFSPERMDEAERLLQLAAARIERIGGDPLLEADLANLRSALATKRGDFPAALAQLEHALAIREKVMVPGHPQLAESRAGRAGILFSLGRYEEAAAVQRQVLAELEGSLGSSHPSLLSVINNLANSEDRLQHTNEAVALHRRSIALREQLYGARSRSVGAARTNLGLVLKHAGDPVAARAELAGALTLLEALDPKDPTIAIVLANLGDLDFEENAFAKAEATLVRALTLSPPSPGAPPHPRNAIIETTLARARCKLGRCREGLDGIARAIVAQKPLPEGHADRLAPLAARAEIELALKRWGDAAASATLVIDRLMKLGAPPEEFADLRLVRARAYLKLGRRRDARADAARARDDLARAKKATTEVDTFLAKLR